MVEDGDLATVLNVCAVRRLTLLLPLYDAVKPFNGLRTLIFLFLTFLFLGISTW